MKQPLGELAPPTRLMLTPGPTVVHPRVYRAMSTPLVGHMDPWFNEVLVPEVQELLRDVFQTRNRTTFPISASGSGGIEASVVNPLEPGDEAIVCVNGCFHSAWRRSPNVPAPASPCGVSLRPRPVDPEDVRRAAKGRKIKLVGLAQGETSTGVFQRIEDYRKVADECGALIVVDASPPWPAFRSTRTASASTFALAAHKRPSARPRAWRR